MIRRTDVACLTAAMCVLCGSPLLAGQGVSAASPVPPATISRSAEGGVTVRAVRLSESLTVDGRLDEPVYTTVPAISDFIQQEPREGEPATEQTEVWILFDNTNLYISARCWDSHPERQVVNEMRRDVSVTQNENIGIILDTFHDKRNGLLFNTNPLGARRDIAITDETISNGNWNEVWDVRTGKFEGGWTVEVVIPFKSLRYKPGPNQVWGINVRRTVRWKNELSFLTQMPALLGQRAIFSVSLAATMVGLEVPPSGRNLEIKPYAISSLRTDRLARPSFSNRGNGNVGVDAKYGVTKSLTLDLTYNPDFAQVEDDLQQVNLTRFSLFFPERREFFLEGQGIFAFGGRATGRGRVVSNTPVMFFSRRIGLTNGRLVPIVAGARLTGKVGDYSIGVLNIQSDEEAAADARPANFSVVRIKRDLFRRSNVGAIYTRRAETGDGRGAGETFGVDALYSASPSLNVNGYFARTRTPGVHHEDTSRLARFDYNTDRFGVQLEHLAVGGNFKPEVGFLRRTDFQRQFALARFSPRPAPTHMKAVRRFFYQGTIEYVENGAGTLETRLTGGSFAIEFQNSDRLTVLHVRGYELISLPFEITSGVTVPVGGYDNQFGEVSYQMGPQRPLSGILAYQDGSLYGGTKRTVGLSRGRLKLSPQLAIEPIASVNWVKLPWGDFTSTVVSARNIYTMTPRMYVSALLQYNSSTETLSTNARFRWEYQPGSELFVVYSDGRDTVSKGFPEIMNRAFVIKINRLFRF